MASFRVFISSTFKNFEFERNFLTQNLYDPLNTFCRQRGYAFHAIDLRWGISNEASLDNKSMVLCLDEIEKCQKTNLKPNFLIMLGDYYGWKPLPFSIEESEAQKLFAELDPEATDLFQRCYKLDVNSIPHEYVLQGRQGELTDNALWATIEERLHNALEHAAKKTLTEEKLDKYTYSATHQEIIQGFLNNNAVKDYVFVFVKEEGNIYKNEQDYLNAKRLKERIIKELPESQYAVYKDNEDFPLAVEKAEDFLERAIITQSEPLVETDKQLQLLNGLRDNYIRDKKLEEKIINSIEESGNQKIFIVADSHEGKTSFLLDIYYRLKKNKKDRIHLWAANSDYEHLSVLDLCQFIIRKVTKGTQNPCLEYDNACYCVQEVLWERLEEQEMSPDQIQEKTENIFLLDGIETLFDFDKIKDMFRSIVLPGNVVFVLTASKEDTIEGNRSFHIPSLTEKQKESLFFSVLSDCNRTVTDEQRTAILPFIHSADPLLIRFLANKAKSMHSYDSVDVGIGSVEMFIKHEIQHLSTSVMYGDVLISRVMLFLALSTHGISEAEMLDLLKQDSEVVAFLKTTANWDFDEKLGIPKVILYRIMSEISPYVMELNDKGSIIYKFKSQTLMNIIFDFYDEDLTNRLYTQYKNYFKKCRVYINSKKQIDQRIARQRLCIALKEDCELIEALGSIDFCDACIKLGELKYLIDGFRRMDLTTSKIYKTIMKYIDQLLVFHDAFLTYAVAEGLVRIDNYKKFTIERSDDVTPKIINLQGEEIAFCYMLTEKTYIVSNGNSLVKINRETGEIVGKLVFNARIVKCCVSNDFDVLLVACANVGLEKGVLHLHTVDLQSWSIKANGEHKIPIQGYLNELNIRLIPYKQNFIVAVPCMMALRSFVFHFYYLSHQSCSNMFSLDFLSSGFVLVSQKYLLMKGGLNEFRLFDLEQKQFVCVKKSSKYLKFMLDRAIVAKDGNTYCVVEGNGVYKLYVERSSLKAHKVFSLFSTTSLPHASLRLLNNCFLLKQQGSEYTDVFSYDGIYIGKCKWDGKTYVTDALDDRICCVDIEGKYFEKEIDAFINYDQKKVQLTTTESWRVSTRAFKRLFNFHNDHDENFLKKIYALSPDGKHTVCLMQDKMIVWEGDRIVFEYFYRSKRSTASDVCFISNRIILWKQSCRKIVIIDLQRKRMKTLHSSLIWIPNCSMIDGSLYFPRLLSIMKNTNALMKKYTNYESEKFEGVELSTTLSNAIKRYSISDDGEVITENLDIALNYSEPLEIVKSLRKSKEARIIFSYAVPSSLYSSLMSNDKILFIAGNYIVRWCNHRLFFYSCENNERLKMAYAFEEAEEKISKSKISVYGGVYYCYLEPLKMILIYNGAAKQIIPYLIDDSVCDVSFDGDVIRMLRKDGNCDTIRIN